MKAIKFFLIGLITVGFVACNNEDGVEDLTSSGATQSVTLKLEGITLNETRAIDTLTSDTKILLNDLTVVFHDDSKIYKNQPIPADSIGAITGSKGMVIHSIHSAATKVLVVGNSANKNINWTSVASIKASSIDVKKEQDVKDLVLYGEVNIDKKSYTEHTDPIEHPNTTIRRYNVAVTIAPLVSRFEIGNIQCVDLGDSIVSLELVGIGLVDFQNRVPLSGTVSANNFLAMGGFKDGTAFGNIFEPGTTAPGGINPFYVFGEKIPAYQEIAWSYDSVPKVAGNYVKLTNKNTKYNPETSKKFAYNFLARTGIKVSLPNIKLELTNIVPKSSYVHPPTWRFVTTAKYSGASATEQITPGYIYTVDYAFKEGNLTPYDPDNQLCVQVGVTVKEWTIKALTPSFR